MALGVRGGKRGDGSEEEKLSTKQNRVIKIIHGK